MFELDQPTTVSSNVRTEPCFARTPLTAGELVLMLARRPELVTEVFARSDRQSLCLSLSELELVHLRVKSLVS